MQNLVPPRVDSSKYLAFSTTFQITLLYHLQLFIQTEIYRPSNFCLQSGHVPPCWCTFSEQNLQETLMPTWEHHCTLSDSRQNCFCLLTQNLRACRHLNLYSYVRVPTCLYLCIVPQITLRHCPPLQYRTSVSQLSHFSLMKIQGSHV